MTKKEEENFLSRALSKKISRRDFIKYSVIGLGGLAVGGYGYKHLFRNKNDIKLFSGGAPEKLWKWSKEGAHYKKLSGNNVQCLLCPYECALEEDDRGICRVRVNKEGKLFSVAYGNPCAVHVDPIEKKPLFHFLPGTTSFSIATAGCNMRCLNCQNWDISQFQPEETQNIELMPKAVVDAAIRNQSPSIAYTYSEPIAFYEYTYDTAKLAREKGIKNLLITAGYINEKPLRELCKYIDASNINLKNFKDKLYRELNGATLQPILNALKILKEENVWFEVTNLVVPSWTDDFDMIKEMSDWLYKNGFEFYPLHFSRFIPMYKLTHLPPTPVETLKKARQIALESGIKYVYIGNIPHTDAENTYCHKCEKLLIERRGFSIISNDIINGNCKYCGQKIPGVWTA